MRPFNDKEIESLCFGHPAPFISEPAKQIAPLELVANGRVKVLQASLYTSKARLEQAKTMDDVF